MAKLRVWWIPQVPMEAFYIPVELDEFIEEKSDRAEEIEAQNKALLEQVHFD